jgi:type I restriction enzyme M protein
MYGTLSGSRTGRTLAMLTFSDLETPTPEDLVRVLEDLLDQVIARDDRVTRREEQLDQLCSVLLLKLESDRRARSAPDQPLLFSPGATARESGRVRAAFRDFAAGCPDIFATERERGLHLSDDCLGACVGALARLRLLDVGARAVSLAFQVLRAAALRQKEGQYFTPQPVIRAGTRLLRLGPADAVLDPACGVGGFLAEALTQGPADVCGIDKDAIAVKLTRALLQLLGAGAAGCVRGDALRTARWPADYPHLLAPRFQDGRFTAVVTNPPFGQNLTVRGDDARAAGLDIARRPDGTFADVEIGLLFLNRAYRWLRPGGRIGIVLPETYFFSTQYRFVWAWMAGRLQPRIVANIPMEAFQGFCRAKTSFYVFEKIA